MSFVSNWLGNNNRLMTGSVSLFSIFVNPLKQRQSVLPHKTWGLMANAALNFASVLYLPLDPTPCAVLYHTTQTPDLYETSKLNKAQMCMDYSHYCKQHHLEDVDISETVNNSMQLGFSLHFVSKWLVQTN